MPRFTSCDLARVAHEANRAFCDVMGDHSQEPWLDCPPDQSAAAIDGVLYRMRCPDASPEEMHNNWVQKRLAQGWTYGPVKDPRLKTHPCMVPYKELPREQQVKDALFSAVVDALRELVEKG